MKQILIFLFFPLSLHSQSSIKGKVMTAQHEPASHANVLLLKSKDSALLKAFICDKEGAYTFNNIVDGDYLLKISFAGHQQTYRAASIQRKNGDLTLETIQLIKEEVALTGVTVVAKKPLLEQKIDRLVINVENSITSAGNTALEVLERSPGITVDHQNNIVSMNGKNGVVIMINGKISHMPISAIVQMLDGMSSGNIEKIELITTPPASLDAEGNAGYINIVLKQNNNYGTNGSLSATLGYGKGMVEAASVNINHRKGSVNIYGDLSYSRIRKPFRIDGYTAITNSGNINESYFHAQRVDTTPNLDARLGMDWQVGKRTVLGILLTGHDNRYSQGEHNSTSIFTNGNLDTIVYHNNSEVNHWYNYSGNINLQRDFNESDKLVVNLDYIYWNNNQPVYYHNAYYDKLNNFIYNQHLLSGKKTPIEIWVAAMDYSKKLTNKISLEAGLKETISTFNNDISFHRYQQNTWVKDSALSATYKLTENYSAAYALFNVSLSKKTEAKLGLRYEYTNSNLGTVLSKNIVDRHYGNLFPSLFISHRLNETTNLSLSYSRRITRPTFNDLAPFTYYPNANTLLTGNPALQPSISDNFSVSYSLRNYLLSISYSDEKNAISKFQPESDSVTNKLVLTAQNLTSLRTISVVVSVPLTVTRWWSMQYNLNTLGQETNAVYKGLPVRLRQVNFNINAIERFTLPKDFSIELSGYYQSRALLGIYRTGATGTVDIGIRKKLPGKNGSLVFNATNIFNTSNFSIKAYLPEHNLSTDTHIYFTRPTYKLTYSRNFGNDKLKGKRERITGAEEEKNRVQ